MPYWLVESVVVVVVLVVGAGAGAAIGSGAGAGAGSAAGAGAGVVVTSPFVADVDVVCEPSFDTRMCVLVWPKTTAGERAIAAIAMSLIFIKLPLNTILWTRPTVFGLSGRYRSKVWTAANLVVHCACRTEPDLDHTFKTLENRMSYSSSPRRTFLASLASAAGATLLAPLLSRTGVANAALVDETWDLGWLGHLKGKHRQVFEVGKKIEEVPGPLHVVGNYLDSWNEAFHLDFPQINTVMSIAGSGFPINVNDAIWEKYKLGEKWQISDGSKVTPTHNVFLDAPATDAKRTSVKGLQARGTIFCQCDKALHGIAHEFATGSHDSVDTIYQELVAGLNPGVKLVPSNTMLVGLAQEHGCAYESV